MANLVKCPDCDETAWVEVKDPIAIDIEATVDVSHIHCGFCGYSGEPADLTRPEGEDEV